jgi:predicted dehydrogenase
MERTIRWGILGTGKIARKFAAALAGAKHADLAAVGSRSPASAEAFGRDFRISRQHGSYEALARDPEVDAIYIATPHVAHRDNALLCLEAGKAVLCEKPLALNAVQGREMAAAAQRRGVFLMEAMWSRFIPAVAKAKELVTAGVIGELRFLAADFGFRGSPDPEGRALNPELGGGALLDVGIYPVMLAHWLFGKPAEIVSSVHRGTTGVDETNAMVFRYASGAMAVLASAVNAVTIHEAFLSGSKGEIRLHAPWWRATDLSVLDDMKTLQTLSLPHRTYAHEADHVRDCLLAGKTESDIMPLADSIAILETLDALRAAWGVRYPAEA